MPTKGNDFNSMTKQPPVLAAVNSKPVVVRNMADIVGDEDTLAASGHKGAPKQKHRTSQHYQAELPSEESAGGGRKAGRPYHFLSPWMERVNRRQILKTRQRV